MNDLSHWDFAVHFSGIDVAALILGVEPSRFLEEQFRVQVVMKRLELDYLRALEQAREEHNPVVTEKQRPEMVARRADDLLESVELEKCWRQASRGISGADDELYWSDQLSDFSEQLFARDTVIRWLKAVGMSSKYPFDRNLGEGGDVRLDGYVDPVDLPWELDVALIAYRAVLNGYGDQAATFRNRLEAFLLQHYSKKLKRSEIERIATVANPDKERGRKKSGD